MPDLTARPIRYIVRFPAAYPHYAEIEARFPFSGPLPEPVPEKDAGKLAVELFLPVWTPGSYLVREYARHIESVTATGPQQEPLTIEKTRKNRWLVRFDHPLHDIILHYRLYCHELTVRTNYLDEDFAMLHGAATFITIRNPCNPAGSQPYEVTLELPPNWSGCWSAMDGDHNTFRAPDYDCLVDSPILAGNPSTNFFHVDGKPHIFFNFGDSSYWNHGKVIEDMEKVVRQYRAMWGELPYERYVFFNLLTGGRGALEHRNSVVLMADRFTMRSDSTYTSWLNLVSHEFCHLWNVKRLRPRELGPFDYENEVYTRNLWIAEGFTEYYGSLTACRAGLIKRDEFLGTYQILGRGTASLSGWIEDLQSTPGRLQQPVSLASFDAWIKFYRADENSRNSSISYYTKGAVIAWLLDAKIRATTSGEKTLDDVMRLALHRYGASQGFTEDDFILIVQDVTGTDLKKWFTTVVETVEELDYAEALAWFGLRFQLPAASKPGDAPPKSWLGVSTKTDAGCLIVTEVLRGSPGYEAGISPADEILGIGDYRVRPDQWISTLELYRPQEVVNLLVSRRDRLITIPVRLGAEPSRRWIVETDPDSTDLQRQHLTHWLASLIPTVH